ncbi:MAG: 50S ribosomal protein L19, partial [Hyphomicrobiales bacterium]
RGRVRRAKLYYLRGRRGKAARITEKKQARPTASAFKGFTKPKGPADDLTLIKGVAEELQGRLNKLGIIRFEQIAAFTDDDITAVDEVLNFKGRIEREDWVGQAKALMVETTAGEVPAEEDSGEAAAEAPAKPAPEKKKGKE